MSEIFMTTRDAIDILNKAQKKLQQYYQQYYPKQLDYIIQHRQEFLVNFIIHAVGHLARTCIEEETRPIEGA